MMFIRYDTMGLDNLLYYVINLIDEGHKWQYQNATNSNKAPLLYFTPLQFIALMLSSFFVISAPSGISHNTIDTLLSSLSIMTGFFLALVVFIYDKYMMLNHDAQTDDKKTDECKNQNYLLQFNALTSYAIFISLIVISILIGILLFGHEVNLSKYTFASSWLEIDIKLTIKLSIVVITRVLLIYFLLDFFILSLYAVCSLFQFLNINMKKKELPYEINKKFVKTDRETLKEKYPRKSKLVKSVFLIFVIGLIICLWDTVKDFINNITQF